jgi:hypothetical protein
MMLPPEGRRAMPRRPFLIVLIVVLGIILLLRGSAVQDDARNVPTPILTLTKVATGKTIYEKAVPVGSPFAIRFIHSIHRTPVEEWFYIDASNRIVLERVIYESLGVGNPSSLEEGQIFRLSDGKLMMDRMNRVLGQFVLATGQVIADHRLIIEGEEIQLARLCPPGTSVLIEARSTGMLRWKGAVNVDRN